MSATTSVSVRPTNAVVGPMGIVQFEATVAGAASTTVTWSIREGAGCGSISPSGVYTAPSSPADCQVEASLDKYGVSSGPAVVSVRHVSSCATEPLRTTGTVFYYCACEAGADPACVPGKDSNPGTDPGLPKLTGYQAALNTIGAGQTIALCRGGAFKMENVYTSNAKCRADSTCDMRDYTPPAHPEWARDQTKRPLLDGARVFVPSGGSVNQGFRFWNLQARNGSSQGLFMGGVGTSDVDICNVSFADTQLGVYFNPDGPRWTVRSSQFDRIQGMSVMSSCTDCVVDGNYFAANSYKQEDYFLHAVYLGGTGSQSVKRFRLTNNEIHGCPSPTAASKGTPVVVAHGWQEDLLVENNLIQCDHPEALPESARPFSVGFSVTDGGYTLDRTEGFYRSIIRRNRVIGFTSGISLSISPDATVEDNLIVPMGVATSSTIGIEIKSDTRAGSTDPTTDRTIVRNNTIYSSALPINGTSPARGVRIIGGRDHLVTNNVIYYGAIGSRAQCFDFPLESSAYAMVSNNACNGTWNTTADVNRVVLLGSPFVNAGVDFTPGSGSPLVNAGTLGSYSAVANGSVSWSAMDEGKARDSQPDIGAFER